MLLTWPHKGWNSNLSKDISAGGSISDFFEIDKSSIIKVSKMSLVYIDQRVIIFHTCCVLISLHQDEERQKRFFLFCLEMKMSAREVHVLISFPASF